MFCAGLQADSAKRLTGKVVAPVVASSWITGLTAASSANALLALADLTKKAPGTRLVWSVRSPSLTPVFAGGDVDVLLARGAPGSSLRQLRDSGGLEFGAGLRITRAVRHDDLLEVRGVEADGPEQSIDGIDEFICATRQRPDLSPTQRTAREARPVAGSERSARPADRPEMRAGASRAWALHRRRQELRSRNDLTDGHLLRAGVLGGGRDRE